MSKVESADLILKLYDLRRETVMREARSWVFSFNPTSADDIMQTMMGEKGAYLRMVMSYWDMAASFVNHGAIDAEMFNDSAGEHIMIFAKIEPFLNELREKFGSPDMCRHLEKVIADMPDGEQRLKKTQERLKAFAAQRAGEATA